MSRILTRDQKRSASVDFSRSKLVKEDKLYPATIWRPNNEVSFSDRARRLPACRLLRDRPRGEGPDALGVPRVRGRRRQEARRLPADRQVLPGPEGRLAARRDRGPRKDDARRRHVPGGPLLRGEHP